MEKRQDRMQQEQDSQDTKLDRIESKVDQISTVLIGVAGTDNGGVVRKLNELCEDHNKLKTLVYGLIGLLVGSGVLGTGIWSAIRFG